MAAETASSVLTTRIDPTSSRYEANMRFMADLVSAIRNEEEQIREGGGAKAIENQHSKSRLTARERIDRLADPGTFSNSGLTLPIACTRNGAAHRLRASSPA